MSSNATISAAPSEGSITLTGTAANDYLSITSGDIKEVHVYLNQAGDGEFGFTTSHGQVLGGNVYQMVWKRGAKTPANTVVYLKGGTSAVKWIAF